MTGRLVSIPAGAAFVDRLAAGLLAETGDDPLALARMTVLLPNRRAGRALAEAFLRATGGTAMLLPRIAPLGDVDADELDLTAGDAPGLADRLDLPPAIAPLARQLLLTRAVAASHGRLAPTIDQAARLAASLAGLIDEIHTERCDPQRLATIVPAQHAAHWQATLDFLGIVTRVWPDILADEGVLDPADRRNRLIEAQAEAWRRDPPADPVIIAGSTGSLPATADLMAAVLALPGGMVVLPGLDRALDDAAWAALDDTHPQALLAALLRRLGVERADVPDWPEATPVASRTRLLAEALRPAATSEAWRDLPATDAADAITPPALAADALAGLERLDCAGPEEEAAAIALMMREALETPGRTAALVTPDRALAARVAASLGRWGIGVDDSGGRPLAETAAGTYLRLAARLAEDPFDPVRLLALLKHPAVAGGLEPGRFRALVRALERASLRGLRHGGGWDGLRRGLDRAEPTLRPALAELIDGLEVLAGPYLAAAAEGRDRPLAEWLGLHVGFAEALAASADQDGAALLWRHEDGEAAATFIAELNAAPALPDVPARGYPALLEALMEPVAVRPAYGSHPRLAILGLVEARLLQADLMILGGLNEGTWPPEPPVDPWMSRPMRRELGLAPPDRRVGRTAHDFTQAAAASRVVLTRSTRVDGTPTVPARWLTRLDTVLRAVGLPPPASPPHAAWARALVTPDAVAPCAPPAPRPPVASRPRRLSVSDVELWRRNPYGLYARRILRLEPLDPLGATLGPAERGQFIHLALDGFARAVPAALPGDALALLERLGCEALADLNPDPSVTAFWWPRFRRIAAWVVTREQARRPGTRPLATETGGRLTLSAPAGPFVLTAKADRIDRCPDGTLEILDYKTGSVPTGAEIEAGLSPQLPLEAAIAIAGGFDGLAAAGGFNGIEAAAVARLTYWRLTGGEPAGEEKAVSGDVATLAEAARTGLAGLVALYDDPATPYPARPRPDLAPRWDAYGHLARAAEWGAGAAGDDGA